MGATGNIRKHVHVLALGWLFHEHRLKRFQFLDQKAGGLRTDGAMKIDSQIAFWTDCVA